MNEDLKNKFTAFIRNEVLFTENEPVLLAVSGGLDSVVMTYLFAQSSYRFAMAHVNFSLRGTESDEDERWVAALAAEHQVPFHSQRFATKACAEEQGVSTQMAARQLRYAWFEEIRVKQGYARVATAHHQDDQLETTLLNLCRGTGVAGLRGLLPRREQLVRPLLFTHRARIEAYAREHQLTWREDRSNASDVYQRNRIRHRIIPQLQQINPNLLTTYQRTQERLLATEQLLNDEVKRVEQRSRKQVGDEVWLDKTVLRRHPQLTLVLAEMIRDFGFSYGQARDVAQCVRTETIAGKTFTTDDHTLLVDRQYLIISKKQREPTPSLLIQVSDTALRLPTTRLTMAHYQSEKYTITRRAEVAAVDEDQLSFPLTLRPWQTGDWFCPLGMTHRKKISDFLVDQKVPLHRKSSVYVLTSDEAVVWVVGWRVDHRFRITDQTRRVYEISATIHS